MLYYVEGDHDKFNQAVLCREKLAKKNPRLVGNLYREGLDLYTNGNIRKAQKKISEATLLRPGFPDLACAAAIVFDYDASPEIGIRFCDIALKIEPSFVPALCAKAKILRAMGSICESDDILDKVHRLNPGLSDHDDIIGMLRARM